MILREAAALLGVQPATLRQAIRRGTLEATKVGRDWHVNPQAVIDYADYHRGRIGGRKDPK